MGIANAAFMSVCETVVCGILTAITVFFCIFEFLNWRLILRKKSRLFMDFSLKNPARDVFYKKSKKNREKCNKWRCFWTFC